MPEPTRAQLKGPPPAGLLRPTNPVHQLDGRRGGAVLVVPGPHAQSQSSAPCCGGWTWHLCALRSLSLSLSLSLFASLPLSSLGLATLRSVPSLALSLSLFLSLAPNAAGPTASLAIRSSRSFSRSGSSRGGGGGAGAGSETRAMLAQARQRSAQRHARQRCVGADASTCKQKRTQTHGDLRHTRAHIRTRTNTHTHAHARPHVRKHIQAGGRTNAH